MLHCCINGCQYQAVGLQCEHLAPSDIYLDIGLAQIRWVGVLYLARFTNRLFFCGKELGLVVGLFFLLASGKHDQSHASRSQQFRYIQLIHC